jgi:channel protein (hemolysin III family)
VLKTVYFDQISDNIGTAVYIGMGWIGLGSWLGLLKSHGFNFAQPIMWGGIAYTVGGIIDRLSWPVILSGVIQWHEVFHVAVLVGLGLHWAFVYSIADRPCCTACPV